MFRALLQMPKLTILFFRHLGEPWTVSEAVFLRPGKADKKPTCFWGFGDFRAIWERCAGVWTATLPEDLSHIKATLVTQGHKSISGMTPLYTCGQGVTWGMRSCSQRKRWVAMTTIMIWNRKLRTFWQRWTFNIPLNVIFFICTLPRLFLSWFFRSWGEILSKMDDDFSPRWCWRG